MSRRGLGNPKGGAQMNWDGATWAWRTAAREAVPPAVDCRGLGYRFGDVAALDDVTFTITPGEVFGLLGPNGAGKTTAIRILTTLLKPATGSARVFGLDTVRARMRVRQAIGYVPQQLSVDASLTGWENVWLFARLFDVPRREQKARIDQALAAMELSGVAGRLASTYSGGMVRRLEMAQALVNRPRLLILDEPTIGLDPMARSSVWARVRELRDDSAMTVLLTTHYMEEAARLCDSLLIMDEGRIVAEGDPAALIREYAGREALELDLAEECDPDALLESLGERANGHEFHDGALTLFADDAEELLRSLDHERFPTETAMVRRATLEDVFLRLTGRSLREGE
jgi:ABC-2 type transport system ATP-binding protein